MCGIAGIINFDGRAVGTDELGRINKALTHRGPDGEGIYCHDNVGIARHRLAIIDLRAGSRPIINEDHSLVLSYNGEVYNYCEIRLEPPDAPLVVEGSSSEIDKGG